MWLQTSDISAHVLLNLLNELGKRDKMQGLPSILSLFLKKFNKFNNTGAQMLDSIFHNGKINLKSHFWRKMLRLLSLLWTSFHNLTEICKPPVVYRFKINGRHMIK